MLTVQKFYKQLTVRSPSNSELKENVPNLDHSDVFMKFDSILKVK